MFAKPMKRARSRSDKLLFTSNTIIVISIITRKMIIIMQGKPSLMASGVTVGNIESYHELCCPTAWHSDHSSPTVVDLVPSTQNCSSFRPGEVMARDKHNMLVLLWA